jgi:hypothetical protein
MCAVIEMHRKKMSQWKWRRSCLEFSGGQAAKTNQGVASTKSRGREFA